MLIAITIASSSCAKKKHVKLTIPPAAPAPETGIASWYGYPYHGRAAANGEIYDMEKLTAAHRTLPFGSWVRVTNLSNGKTVDVRVTDRGPFVDGRIIDLSHAAARAIDLIGPGITQVRLDIISTPAVAQQDLYAVQIGAFRDSQRAERSREAMEKQFGSARIVYRPGRPELYRVLVGAEPSMDRANLLAEKIRSQFGEAFVVRLDRAPLSAAAGASQD